MTAARARPPGLRPRRRSARPRASRCRAASSTGAPPPAPTRDGQRRSPSFAGAVRHQKNRAYVPSARRADRAAALVPAPLTAATGSGRRRLRLVGRAQQPAAEQQRDVVAAVSLLAGMSPSTSSGAASHDTSAPSSSRAQARIRSAADLLVADDAARHMPPGPEELVVAPGEQRPRRRPGSAGRR